MRERLLPTTIACCLLAAIPVCGPAEPLVFEREAYRLTVDPEQGSPRSLENRLTGETTLFATDEIFFELGDSIAGSYLHPVTMTSRTDGSCAFEGEMDGIGYKRVYAFPAGRAYFERSLSITNRRPEPVIVKRVIDGSFKFGTPFLQMSLHRDNMDRMDSGTEVFTETETPSLYQTAINVFLRSRTGGLFIGLKYPYFDAILSSDRMALPYDVNVRLSPGESLDLPLLFCGVYEKTGSFIRKEMDWEPRIITTGQEILDVGEVRAMQQVMRDHLPHYPAPWSGYSIWLNSWWANPDLRGPIGPEQVRGYRDLIDQVRMAGSIDSLLIAPVWLGWAGFISACPEIDAIGDDALFPVNDEIREVLEHSHAAGVPVWGFCEPNSIARNYRADRPDWKLQPSPDPEKRLIQNCHANPAYEDWFYRLTCSVLDTARVSGWAWDHSWVRRPMFCYDSSHGHEPGNCEFQQYRNVTGMLQRLRERYPGHFFEIYWGLKEAGPWSLRGLNSLENAYENNSPAPPGMGAADDLRFQHWYNHNYRFIPTYMNLAQINDRKEKNGLAYSILSCLSASTHASLADWTHFATQSEADTLFAEVRRWKAWATTNLDYLRDRIDLFGQPCRKDGIDGTAHIVRDRGFIFVFNPTDAPRRGSIPLGGMIGLTDGGQYSIEQINGSSPQRLGVWSRGEQFVFSVSPRSALLFELKATGEPVDHPSPEPGSEVQPAFWP